MAMFDIRPPKKSGGLDFEKPSRAKAEINLRREAIPQTVKPVLVEHQIAQSQLPIVKKETEPAPPASTEEKKPQEPMADQTLDSKYSILREFEKTLIEQLEPTVELAKIGAKIHPFIKQKPSSRLVIRQKKKEPAELVAKPIPAIPRVPAVTRPIAPSVISVSLPATPASGEIDFWLSRPDLILAKTAKTKKAKPKTRPRPGLPGGRFWIYSSGLVLMIVLSWLVIEGGFGARDNIIQNGSNAVANLEEAKQKLEDFNFQDAANSFALAYDDLNKASGTLNELGASFLSVFGNLPGLGKINAANDLVEAGQNISKAGENLALALGTLYDSNPLSFLNASAGSGSKSISKLLGEFKTVLVNADRNIKKAGGLLADIDSSVIPEDKQPLLLNFKEKIPQFQEYIGNAIDYSDFLLKFVGSSGKKTYLVLLQNNSELRPTGGFPGTYAVITFNDGYLEKVFVDDIYQIDANLRENIVPPLQIQHITPTWGMRDANWFADFPTSARKIEEFYQKESGNKVDGILTITPDVIAGMLKTTGPVDMPEYDLALGADNFLTEIQNEVEYEADRSKPKKILTDLQPRFFEKLSEQDKNGWLEIFKVITKAVQEKHILAYFNDSNLQKTALDGGLGGEMKQVAGDFLEIVFANVKGSKTDLVTDSSFGMKTSLTGDGGVEHELKISRVHNGGDSQYGFYNRDNPAYVKVFVPQGSVLESVIGQSITEFRPLISYEGFERDSDLKRLEGGISHPVAGVDVFEESGKTVFGFWLIVKPKEAKSVVLKYLTPVAEAAEGSYNLYWQKQSGTGDSHINFSFELPDGASVADKNPDLQLLDGNLVLNSNLSVDKEIKIEFK